MAVTVFNNIAGTLETAIFSDTTNFTVRIKNIDPWLNTMGTYTFTTPLFFTIDDGTNVEIVRTTSITVDSTTSTAAFIVERAFESTSTSNFAAGTPIEHRLTAGMLSNFVTKDIVSMTDSATLSQRFRCYEPGAYTFTLIGGGGAGANGYYIDDTYAGGGGGASGSKVIITLNMKEGETAEVHIGAGGQNTSNEAGGTGTNGGTTSLIYTDSSNDISVYKAAGGAAALSTQGGYSSCNETTPLCNGGMYYYGIPGGNGSITSGANTLALGGVGGGTGGNIYDDTSQHGNADGVAGGGGSGGTAGDSSYGLGSNGAQGSVYVTTMFNGYLAVTTLPEAAV